MEAASVEPSSRAGCLFCRIVAGDEPAHVVYEDPAVMGFLDVRPVFKGHVLLVPRRHIDTLTELPTVRPLSTCCRSAGWKRRWRRHIDTLTELPTDLAAPLLLAAQHMARAVRDGLGAQGSFVAMNNTVSQSVPHLHVHVVPRTKGDGLRGFFWPRVKYADGEAEQWAQLVRAALAVPR